MNALRPLPLLAVVAALVCVPVVSEAGVPERPERPLVYVPVLPYEYLFERLGGDWIDVRAIVQVGGDCHEYSPSPRQLTEIAKANLLFSGELTFEANFFIAVGDGVTGPKHISLLEGLDLIEGSCGICETASALADGEAAASAHHHDHDDLKDPHVWLSPRNLLVQAQQIAPILKAHTPDEADADIDANLAALEAELTELDAEIAEVLAPVSGQPFYVYHAAFGYFAEHYGLEQKAIEISGRRPTPRQVADIARSAVADGVKVIFVQPQFDQSSARSLAETIGGRVQTLDPLDRDVLANLRVIAQTIRDAY